MKVYSARSIRNIENACFASGISELRLMENAGVACAKVIRTEYNLETETGKKIAVLCGKGKNGGDGFVIARKMYEIGAFPTIILTDDYPRIDEPVEMFERAKELGIRALFYNTDTQRCEKIIAEADIIVDCIFGIGYHGLADAKTKEIFSLVNACEGEVVSIDLPSGLDGAGEDYDPSHINADLTISISALKPVHINPATEKYCGKIKVVNINIDKKFFEMEQPVAEISDGESISEKFPRRNKNAHKGDFGHLLMLCGSFRMPGAAVFGAKAAERSGAGKITLAFPDKAYPAITSKLNEPLFMPLESDENGFFGNGICQRLDSLLENKTAVLVGCGIGTDIGSALMLEALMAKCKVPVLVDADGINIISQNINILENRKGITVLTPHLAEFSRLTGKPISVISADRQKAVKEFCDAHPNCVLLLKGRRSLIGCKDKILYINSTGNAGLAQGGTGDVLAGLCAGFLAEGMPAIESAVCAAYIHGEAGDLCAERLSQRGMTTDDLISFIPSSLKKYCWE